MSKSIKTLLLFTVISLVSSSCGDKNQDAKLYLEDIHAVYQSGDYELAKLKIDSIKILFPKAFDQIKEGMALLQDVRKDQNNEQIAFCDSLIAVISPKIDSLKNYFTFDINKEYQETGRYLPKGAFSNSVLTSTILRSGVNEDGQLFIESVYVGGNHFHNKVNIKTKDGLYAETLPVTGDGLNFRFTDLGRQYEVIKFAGSDENGTGKFVFAYSDKPLTVTLTGKNTTSFPLSTASKKAISDSYQLSEWILELDSIKAVKEKSEILIKYLDSKKDTTNIAEVTPE